MRIGIKLSTLVLICLSQGANAITQDENDWANILGQIQDSQTGKSGILYDTNEARSGSLYASRVSYQFQGANADGDFSSNEAVKMVVTLPSGETIETEKYMNPKELSDWAMKHKEQLLKAIKPITSSGTTPVSVVSHEIIQSSITTRQRQKANEIKKAKKGAKGKVVDSGFSSLVIMDSEKASMHIYGIKATSSAFKFSYDSELESGNDVGALFSYRKTKRSDDYSTNISLSPYYKYYHTINDKIEVMGVGNLLINKRFAENTYLDYGIGLAAIPSYYVNDKLSFSLPVGVQILKTKVTNEGSSTLAKIMSDDYTSKSINYGLGAEYAIKPNWYVNLNVLRTQEIDPVVSTIMDKVTYYNVGMTYYSELFNYKLGYKTVKNVANYDEDAYMVSAQYNW